MAESHKKPRQPPNGELPEVPAQHLGDIGLVDAEAAGGGGLIELLRRSI